MRGRKRRINGDVNAPEVMVVGPDSSTREVMPTSKALVLAQGQGLDLVELDPVANPPVCKILDFRKYTYEVVKARVHAEHKHVELEIGDNHIKEKE